MSEESKKVEQPEQEKTSELTENDLEQVSGGGINDPFGGVDVGLGKKPNKSSAV
jgi:bacteriocin-like protein